MSPSLPPLIQARYEFSFAPSVPDSFKRFNDYNSTAFLFTKFTLERSSSPDGVLGDFLVIKSFHASLLGELEAFVWVM